MATLEYKDQSLGLSVALNLATDLLSLNFSQNIWMTVVRVFLNTVGKIIEPAKKFFFEVYEFGETIIVQLEASKARINKKKMIAVAREYEIGIEEVENDPVFSPARKAMLIARLNTALENHLDRLVITKE
jgi:hypothetical protein